MNTRSKIRRSSKWNRSRVNNESTLHTSIIESVTFAPLKGSHENAKPIPKRKKNKKRGY